MRCRLGKKRWSRSRTLSVLQRLNQKDAMRECKVVRSQWRVIVIPIHHRTTTGRYDFRDDHLGHRQVTYQRTKRNNLVEGRLETISFMNYSFIIAARRSNVFMTRRKFFFLLAAFTLAEQCHMLHVSLAKMDSNDKATG
jgi:hypothetical protein